MGEVFSQRRHAFGGQVAKINRKDAKVIRKEQSAEHIVFYNLNILRF
jgi:hypothetical protein